MTSIDNQCTVSLAKCGDVREWDEFAQRKSPSHIFAWQWRQIIESTFGHEPVYIVARQNGRICGVLPLFLVRTLFRGRSFVSIPYLNGGGVLADSASIFSKLIVALGDLEELKQVNQTEMRCFSAELGLSKEWRVLRHKALSRIPLIEEPEILFSRFSGKVRNQIRRSMREKLSPKIATGDSAGPAEIDGFYEVFCSNMRELGTPVFPKRLFEETLRRFGGKARLGTVARRGEIVAGGICVGVGEECEIIWASALRHYSREAPNMLLYWALIADCCRSGYRSFNFGRSTVGSGSHRFKAQWGVLDSPMWWYYHQRRGRFVHVAPERAGFNVATRVWRKLPRAVTDWVGPWLTRGLP